MKKLIFVTLAVISFAAPIPTQAGHPKSATALVYRGPGSCNEGCSDAAALMASMAGLEPIFVGPSETDPEIFSNAVVWIQPGGASRTVAMNMIPELKTRLQNFVRDGGGYVGFCAGGFLATAKVGQLQDEGLGFLPGSTALYDGVPDEAVVLPIQWGTETRAMYWEGGPSFQFTPGESGAEIMATYPNGTVASVRSHYGAGRVYATGLHPEAPQRWRNYFQLPDADGLDYDLAVGMIRWARKSTP